MNEQPKRGRKRLTPEQREAAMLARKAKYKNIMVDADLVEALNKAADLLEQQLGFRPTLSQTLRYLIKTGAPHHE